MTRRPAAIMTFINESERDQRSRARQWFRIDKVPAIVVLGGKSGRENFGRRFLGAPAGYEFAALIVAIGLGRRRCRAVD
jgi:hypothetical protein